MGIKKPFTAISGVDASDSRVVGVSSPTDSTDAANKAFASNASNITSGTLGAAYGGTGLSTINTNQILLGGANNTITQSADLYFNASTDELTIGTARITGTSTKVVLASTATNSGIDITSNGTGVVNIGNSGGGYLRFSGATVSGPPSTNISISSSASINLTSSDDVNITLPNSQFSKVSIVGPSASDYATNCGANDLINKQYVDSIIPSQSGQTSKFLSTNGTALSWNTAVTSVGLNAGTGISISGSPITTASTITVTNVGVTSLSAGSGISVSASTGSVTISTSGVVSSVAGTGTVNGITLSGTVTSTGNITLGGTLSNVDLGTQTTGTLAVARGGTGQTSTQAAMNTLAGGTTNARILRANGTNVVLDQLNLATDTTGTLAVANGGTGATTADGARTALGLTVGTNVVSTTGTGATGTWSISVTGNAGTVSNGVYTNVTYSDPTWITSIAGSKISGNISGNAGNVSGTVGLGNGGTGATTAQGALNALAGGVTANRVLRGNGTNVVLAQVALATDVSGTLPVANGGTGGTTAADARTQLGLAIGTNVPSPTGTGASGTWGISITGNAATVSNGVYTNVTYSNPTWITSINGSIVTGNIGGNAGNVTGIVGIANGGTGQSTAQAALNALAGATTANRVLRGNGTNIVLAQVALATDVSGTLPTANGGTGLTTTGATGTVLAMSGGSPGWQTLSGIGQGVGYWYPGGATVMHGLPSTTYIIKQGIGGTTLETAVTGSDGIVDLGVGPDPGGNWAGIYAVYDATGNNFLGWVSLATTPPNP